MNPNYKRGNNRGRDGDAPRPNYYNDSRNYNYDNSRSDGYQSREYAARRGSMRNRGGQKKESVPKETVAPTVPKPQHLSKTTSVEKNDPLYHEAWFPEAGDEFVPEPDVQEIYPSFDALTLISEVTYKTAVATKVGFSKRVPESAWAYYLAVHATMRMFDIQISNQEELTFEQQRFVDQVKGKFTLPEFFTKYLSGMGNTAMPSSRDLRCKFKTPAPDAIVTTDGKSGWFGRVGADTHYLYKSYPSLPVYASRMQADLRMSGIDDDTDPDGIDELDPDDLPEPGDRRWNLPPAIRCQEQGCGLPTENLLGYKFAERLSPDKINFLMTNKVTTNNFPSSNRSYVLNIDLLTAIDIEFRQIEHIKVGIVPTLPIGSVGQLPYLMTRRLPLLPEARQSVIPRCAYTKLGGAGYIGISFGYRFSHLTSNGRKPWSVYNWNGFMNVPEAWSDTINTLREDEPEEINISRFVQPEFELAERLKTLMNKSVITK